MTTSQFASLITFSLTGLYVLSFPHSGYLLDLPLLVRLGVFAGLFVVGLYYYVSVIFFEIAPCIISAEQCAEDNRWRIRLELPLRVLGLVMVFLLWFTLQSFGLIVFYALLVLINVVFIIWDEVMSKLLDIKVLCYADRAGLMASLVGLSVSCLDLGLAGEGFLLGAITCIYVGMLWAECFYIKKSGYQLRDFLP